MKRLIATGLMISMSLSIWAQAPEMFRYQGRLVDGTNLVNAIVPMSFKLYDALSGGNKLYEDSNSVLVVDGLYSTYIGDNTIYGSLTNAMTNVAVYLELTVNEATLSPRERLVSVPYALNAPSTTPATVNGDPTAVSNEVINARWTKNFYANGDITMSDKETGLMWPYNASPSPRIKKDFINAGYECTGSSYAGYSDWRAPSKIALAELFFSSEHFNYVKNDYYWSGTSDGTSAWSVSMGNGNVYSQLKNITGYAWPVRGGK